MLKWVGKEECFASKRRINNNNSWDFKEQKKKNLLWYPDRWRFSGVEKKMNEMEKKKLIGTTRLCLTSVRASNPCWQPSHDFYYRIFSHRKQCSRNNAILILKLRSCSSISRKCYSLSGSAKIPRIISTELGACDLLCSPLAHCTAPYTWWHRFTNETMSGGTWN